MMIWQQLGLPEGAKFVPEDHEVINLYLIKQVRGQPLGFPHGAMKYHKSVYGSSDDKPLPPWKYCNDDTAVLDYEKHYFFTMLNRVGDQDRVARTVGNYVAWHVSYTKDIYDPKTQKIIGAKKLLNFKVYEKDGMRKTEWIMHEFSLAGDLLEGADPELCSKLVLCVIQNTEKKCFDHKGMKSNFKHCFTYQNQAIAYQSPVPNNNFTTSYNHTASAAIDTVPTGTETGISSSSSGTYVEVGDSCTNQVFNSEATQQTKRIRKLHHDMGIGMEMPSLPLELGNQAVEDVYQSSLPNPTNMGALYMDYNFRQESTNMGMPSLPPDNGFEFENQANQDVYQSSIWNPTNIGALYTNCNFDQETGMDMPSLPLDSEFNLGNQGIQDAYHSTLPNPPKMEIFNSEEAQSKKTCCLSPLPPNIVQSSNYGGFIL